MSASRTGHQRTSESSKHMLAKHRYAATMSKTPPHAHVKQEGSCEAQNQGNDGRSSKVSKAEDVHNTYEDVHNAYSARMEPRADVDKVPIHIYIYIYIYIYTYIYVCVYIYGRILRQGIFGAQGTSC
jgi:hypothetical protein